MNIANKVKNVILQELVALQKEQTFESCGFNKPYCDGVKHGIKLARKLVQDRSFADLTSDDAQKHGYWISKGNKLECSVCESRAYLGTDDPGIHEEEKKIRHFCFNCGAIMDAKEEIN